MAQIDQLKKKRGQLDARISNLEMKEKTRRRKEDTRRKIILGGWLLERMEKDPKAQERVLNALDKRLSRKMDRALFDFGDGREQGGA